MTTYEVFKVVLREAGENKTLQSIAAMKRGTVVNLTAGIAMPAAKLSLQYNLANGKQHYFLQRQTCISVLYGPRILTSKSCLVLISIQSMFLAKKVIEKNAPIGALHLTCDGFFFSGIEGQILKNV